MTFTQEEMAAVERIRRYQRQWRFFRWLLLLCGVVSAVALVPIVHGMFALTSRVGPNAPPTAADAWRLAELHTPMIMLIAIATWFILRTLLQWRTGDPVFALLVRLVDDTRAMRESRAGDEAR